MRVVLMGLKKSSLLAPGTSESEPAFTGRIIVPAIRDILRGAGLRQVVVSGDGSRPAPSVSFWGLTFKPDIALSLEGERLCAFECKFLTRSGRQDSLSEAIGQAMLYRLVGYPSACVVLIDKSRARIDPDNRLSELLGRTDVSAVRFSQIPRRDHIEADSVGIVDETANH